MALFRSAMALVWLSACATSGCGSDSNGPPLQNPKAEDVAFSVPTPPVLAPDVVNADQHFSDQVTVTDDRLTILTAGNEAMIAKINCQ